MPACPARRRPVFTAAAPAGRPVGPSDCGSPQSPGALRESAATPFTFGRTADAGTSPLKASHDNMVVRF